MSLFNRKTEPTPQIESLSAKARTNPAGLVNELVEVTRKAMAQKYAAWLRYRRKMRNEWYLGIPERRRPLYSTNYLFSKVQTVKAYMSLQIPEPSIVGTESSDDTGARFKQKLLDWALGGGQAAWKKHSRELILEGEICGVSWLKVTFDPSANDGDGGPRLDVIPAEFVLVDPKAVKPEHARWVIHWRPDVSAEEIYQEYGVWPSGGADKDRGNSGDNRPDEQKKDTPGSLFDVYECYLRDYTTETVEVEEQQINEETGEVVVAKVKQQRRLYPTWRVITVAGNTVLEDKPLPYEHGELPLIPYKCNDDATTLYPASIIEILEPLQDHADALDEQIYRNIRLIANRQRIINTASGIRQTDNMPGREYYVNGDLNQAMKWDEPPSLGQEVFQYRADIEERMDKISGIFEVTQGRTERGVTAYSAIATLQDASTRTIQMRLEILADVAEAMARQVLSLLKQYLGPYKSIRIAGGEALVVVDDYPQEAYQDGELVWDAEQKAAWREQNGIHVVLADIDERYDIMVSADNALPSSKAQRAKVAMDVFNMQDTGSNVIDAEALLEALDWPGRAEILRRKREKEQAVQDIMGQMQGAVQQQQGEQPAGMPQTAEFTPQEPQMELNV
ncbi:MAG TPA: hypothetical protein PKV43_05670 [Armatimonadota bacterium]|nr:hypothetical protein [Armatimonadota bacterium]